MSSRFRKQRRVVLLTQRGRLLIGIPGLRWIRMGETLMYKLLCGREEVSVSLCAQ